MTIKEFAHLCGCNPQTLRYYDHVDLLKPVKVDQWSGYRYYEKEQAFAFVKIKNLQKAGFSIEEIKDLLDADNSVIYRALETKIAQEERKLQEIREIRQSYQNQMNQIQEKIDQVRKKVTESMTQYDPIEEFAISAEEYDAIIDNVNLCFENLSKSSIEDIGYNEFSDGDEDEETEYLDLLNNPDFTAVYERHGWTHVKDFLEELGELEDGSEYALVFQVDQSKNYNMAFGSTMLGIMLAKNPDKKRSLSCNVGESQDGKNHFWLLLRKH